MNELVEYKSSLCSLKNLLGLGCLHILEKEELLPYITKILSTLNSQLIMEDKDSMEENIKLLVDYYNDGLEKLTTPGKMEGFVEEYGFSKQDPNFKQRFFVASWMNVFTTIYLQEMYNYAYLFTDQVIDCHECCGSISEDEKGNAVFIPGKTNISSKYISSCGCGG